MPPKFAAGAKKWYILPGNRIDMYFIPLEHNHYSYRIPVPEENERFM
ncbi:hypothetical protein [Methanoculleus sp.]|jgi:hypothetical protein|nr:hypothetical protein [Methanoculleus sp.]MCK9316889.1 hypothetical protein [Methanoculleus sp.]